MEAEEGALAHGFVSGIELGSVVGGEGVAFVMIEAVSIGGDA
jgi:hypothetical protein